MKSMFGLTGIQLKVFEIVHDNADEVNDFLREYDGNIIDVSSSPMALGMTKILIVYKATD